MKWYFINFFIITTLLCTFAETAIGESSYLVISDGKKIHYSLLKKTSKTWKICALLPNGRDKYWWGVSHVLNTQAEKLKVNLAVYDAGSYNNIDLQKKQLKQCEDESADAFIIAAVDPEKLNYEIDRLIGQGKIVIDLINGIENPNITSHSIVSWSNVGKLAFDSIIQIENDREISIGVLPGPKDSKWVESTFQAIIKSAELYPNVKLINIGYGATEAGEQASLIRTFFAENSVDYVISNAVAANIMVHYNSLYGDNVKIISFYSNLETIENLKNKYIDVTITDFPLIQAKLAIDSAIRALGGEKIPSVISPTIKALKNNNLSESDIQGTLSTGKWLIRKEFTKN